MLTSVILRYAQDYMNGRGSGDELQQMLAREALRASYETLAAVGETFRWNQTIRDAEVAPLRYNSDRYDIIKLLESVVRDYEDALDAAGYSQAVALRAEEVEDDD